MSEFLENDGDNSKWINGHKANWSKALWSFIVFYKLYLICDNLAKDKIFSFENIKHLRIIVLAEVLKEAIQLKKDSELTI